MKHHDLYLLRKHLKLWNNNAPKSIGKGTSLLSQRRHSHIVSFSKYTKAERSTLSMLNRSTDKDVDLLIKKGIIENQLSDRNAVAEMFNGLGVNTWNQLRRFFAPSPGSNKDVDLLIKKAIIENWLGDSNAVAKMFNGLAVNILTSDFNEKYSCILKGLNDFCEKPWNIKVATLKRDYCNTPWRTVASITGIFLLILTVVQTIFSILQI
ncbi:uncharacterized protein LOC130939225 [Arachis stenosperma]|uniref:uncharacterized protein LOC130939225 n=1 Tax=Arachis stenosperma TaxID=217475 RepID=UPI0025AD482C|nr:uncharacterized protein LOC130939225 [Arachis stenosperma]